MILPCWTLAALTKSFGSVAALDQYTKHKTELVSKPEPQRRKTKIFGLLVYSFFCCASTRSVERAHSSYFREQRRLNLLEIESTQLYCVVLHLFAVPLVIISCIALLNCSIEFLPHAPRLIPLTLIVLSNFLELLETSYIKRTPCASLNATNILGGRENCSVARDKSTQAPKNRGEREEGEAMFHKSHGPARLNRDNETLHLGPVHCRSPKCHDPTVSVSAWRRLIASCGCILSSV